MSDQKDANLEVAGYYMGQPMNYEETSAVEQKDTSQQEAAQQAPDQEANYAEEDTEEAADFTNPTWQAMGREPSSHHILENKLQSGASPMSLPLEFLKVITCDFSDEQELGRGGYGVVYKGVFQNGKVIAVKRLMEAHLIQDKQFQNEVSSFMGIKHQNIVQFLGYCAVSRWQAVKYNGKYIFAELPERLLCFEYLPNGSLDKHISNEFCGLGWDIRYRIIEGICQGLHYLHKECNIIHLDLKPSNILVDDNMVPKIADFGLSRFFGPEQTRIITTSLVGSFGYMSPEYLFDGIISTKADIFSFGVIIIQIITGDRKYPRGMEPPEDFIEMVLKNWRNRLETVSLEIDSQQIKRCVKIGLSCLDADPKKRPTTGDIIHIFNRSTTSGVCNDTWSPTDKVLSAEFNMPSSSFARCSGEDTPGVPDNRGPHPENHPARNDASYRTADSTTKAAQPVEVQPIAVPAIPVEEIREVTKGFGVEALIGGTYFCNVYFGVLRNGRSAWIQSLDSSKQPDQEFLAQIFMASMLKHDNVVELLGYCFDGNIRILAYEFGTMGSLHDMLHGRKDAKGAQPGPALSWVQRVKIALGAAKGLEYLHDKVQPRIIHCNIKSNNILLFDDDVAKIANFNLSNHAPTLPETEYWSTSEYYAPEVCSIWYSRTDQPNTKSDVYNFGVVLLELLTGRNPLQEGLGIFLQWVTPRLEEERLRYCVDPRLAGYYPPKTVAKFGAIAKLCLEYAPACRPEMSVIVQALQPLLNASYHETHFCMT